MVAEPHDAIEIIVTKRDGGELSDSQIDWVIDAYTRGEVADEQMSALAMAILLNGMNRTEIARWTAASAGVLGRLMLRWMSIVMAAALCRASGRRRC